MRAFTIIFIGAMLGAVSLATIGVVSTISQTHRNTAVFSLAGGIALASSERDRQAAFSAATAAIVVRGRNSLSPR